jgi:hypothetical protein
MGLVRFFFFSLFLIELSFFFCSLFFTHAARKIVLEKNNVIKLYKVTKIKGCGETTIHPTLIAS